MRYARERLADVQPELAPLTERHYDELGQVDMELAPDWARLLALEAAGVLVLFTVRDDARALVGYAIFFVQPHIHYRHSVCAINDVIWLAPECRGGTGMRFLRYLDMGLAALGAQKIFYHAKPAHPALGRALRHLGYTVVEHIYARGVA